MARLSVFSIVPCILVLALSGVCFAEPHHKVTKKDHGDHGVPMGLSSHNCDDGKTKLETDWDGSPVNYTCYSPKLPLAVKDIEAISECFHLPENYSPRHYCMDKVLSYNSSLPTYGDHRPLWPIYGEYKFVPVQRWLHSVEHGAVVMLYDPCAHPALVHRLRRYVRSCIRKHIITPYNYLPNERPLALVTWGCSLLMSTVEGSKVTTFIKKTALKGPEGSLSKEGQYSKGLIRKASQLLGSDEGDTILCPLLEH